MTTPKPGKPPDYGATMLSHAVPTERERLRLVEAAYDPVTLPVLSGLGLAPGWRCLEIGAGAGSIARWLAGQGAEVVATDIDTTFLDQLNNGTNLRVLKHNVVTDDFPPGSFDLVHSRLLLEHLPARDAVVAKAARWLSPGGWLVIEDNAAFPMSASPYPAMRRLWEAGQEYVSTAIGTDLDWAPQLPTLLTAAGLVDVNMSVKVHVSDRGPATAFMRATVSQLGPAIVAEGLLSEAELIAGLRLYDDPSYVDLSVAIVSAWGRQPPQV